MAQHKKTNPRSRGLLTEKGYEAMANFLDENAGLYESAGDLEMLVPLKQILDQEGLYNSFPLKHLQLPGIIQRIAKSTYDVPTKELLAIGPSACLKKRVKKRKARTVEDSDQSESPAPDCSGSLNSGSELQQESQAVPAQDIVSLALDSELEEEIEDDVTLEKPPRQAGTGFIEVSAAEEQMIRLFRQFLDRWGPTDPPTSRHVQKEMSDIFASCGKAIESFIVNMDLRQLAFDHLTNNCKMLGQVVTGVADANEVDQVLCLTYHKNNLTLATFFLAVTGAAIFSWVLKDHIQIDDPSRSALYSQLAELGLPDYAHSDKDIMLTVFENFQGLIDHQPVFVQRLAKKYARQLLEVLTCFREPVQPRTYLATDRRSTILARYDAIMVDVFMRACNLRMILSRSPGKYRVKYFASGDKFDDRCMSRLSEHGSTTDKSDIVGVCFSPAIYGSDEDEEDMMLLCHAMVI